MLTALRSPWTICPLWRYTRPSETWWNCILPMRYLSRRKWMTWSYYLQSVTVRVALNIIASISVLHVRHDDERPVVELVCTKKFWMSWSVYVNGISWVTANTLRSMCVCLNIDHVCITGFQYDGETTRKNFLLRFLAEFPAGILLISHHRYGRKNTQWSWAWYRHPWQEPWERLAYYCKFPRRLVRCRGFRIRMCEQNAW